jgi:hypothetical protein
MKIITKLFLTSQLLLTISSSTNAQLFQLGAGGGLTQILAPESYTNYYSTEWNVGVIAKLGLPLLPITPRAFFIYNSLYGAGEDSSSTFYTDQEISELGVGIQYNFVPLPAGFDPYIALDLEMSSYSGLYRFGGGIGLGTEITIIPIIDVDVYACYKMYNLVGKSEGEETITAFTLDAFILFSFL